MAQGQQAAQTSAVAACVSDIEVADFVALDLEFSGLFLNTERDRSLLSLENYFTKCVESIPHFLPLQLGLCCGRWRAENGGFWELRSHEFNLWPSERRIFTADMQSLRFLRQHGFDFNSYFEKAYSYSRLPAAADEKSASAKKIHPSHATKVLLALRESRLPLVVHNGLLDLLHLYDKFVDKLPDEAGEFAKLWLQSFPLLFDTRLIAQEGRTQVFRLSGGLSLEALHRHLTSSAPGGAPRLRFERAGPLASGGSAHSAGHDSLLTAEVFLLELDVWLRASAKGSGEHKKQRKEEAPPETPSVASQETPAAARANGQQVGHAGAMNASDATSSPNTDATPAAPATGETCGKEETETEQWTTVSRRKRPREAEPASMAAMVSPALLETHEICRRFHNRLAIVGASPGSLSLGSIAASPADATAESGRRSPVRRVCVIGTQVASGTAPSDA